MSVDDLQSRAQTVRRFNRFYTRQIGLLHEHLHNSPFSLTEARILYELAHRSALTNSDLCSELGLDPGYLSRVVAGFEKQGLIEKSRSPMDGRAVQLKLTAKGRKTYKPLNLASQSEISAMLQKLALPEQQELIDAMRSIERLLGHAQSE